MTVRRNDLGIDTINRVVQCEFRLTAVVRQLCNVRPDTKRYCTLISEHALGSALQNSWNSTVCVGEFKKNTTEY